MNRRHAPSGAQPFADSRLDEKKIVVEMRDDSDQRTGAAVGSRRARSRAEKKAEAEKKKDVTRQREKWRRIHMIAIVPVLLGIVPESRHRQDQVASACLHAASKGLTCLRFES
ncbi:hypothetical protein QEN71_31100 [Paraburkholderia sabiae]|uniref:Uncharacterized protein n=1 Tax=Paraburkholderia sabiae TaxID=273251 RepID=A0ABU9Q8U0_9BURK|nr:hypothetical protein [Paraburkholderia sabiae]WJZ79249.1 hypothetical protein QEN71_31100 [Paraburkholderia sabiae]